MTQSCEGPSSPSCKNERTKGYSHETAQPTTFSNNGTANDDCRLETEVAQHIVTKVCQRVAQLWEVPERVKQVSFSVFGTTGS